MGEIRRLHDEQDRSLVMGIVNATPDSFYPDSRRPSQEDALHAGLRMVDEGADLIDVGGESTRPGSKPVPADEEEKRVVPVVEALADQVDVPISVDTRRASTAQAALRAGASIVNDTSAGRDDPRLLDIVAEHGADVVLMHRQGAPDTMQEDPTYEAVVPEVAAFLLERVEAAMDHGVPRDRITVDPGIGFGKRLEHNLALIQAAGPLTRLGLPVLLGVSRKSMFGQLLDREVDERLPGSLAVVAHAAGAGVHVIRVHDVAETVDVVRTVAAVEASG